MVQYCTYLPTYLPTYCPVQTAQVPIVSRFCFSRRNAVSPPAVTTVSRVTSRSLYLQFVFTGAEGVKGLLQVKERFVAKLWTLTRATNFSATSRRCFRIREQVVGRTLSPTLRRLIATTFVSTRSTVTYLIVMRRIADVTS